MTSCDAYRFRFQVSDWTLFSIARPVQVLGLGITAPPRLQLPPLAPGSQGIMLRSVPIRGPGTEPTGADLLLRYELQRFHRRYIEMQGLDFEAYKSKFSGKTRSTLQRKVKRFAESCGGALRWERYTTPPDIEVFWGHARAVSRLTYQERLLGSGLPEDGDYKSQAVAMAAAGNVLAFLLFDGAKPVSYLYCPVFDGVVVYAYLGYDPDYRDSSVGTVLQWLALESLFAENRFRMFDFTEGDGDHKRLFATSSVECANVVFLRPTLVNRSLIFAHRGFIRTVERVGRWLEEAGLRSRIRRWLRNAA